MNRKFSSCCTNYRAPFSGLKSRLSVTAADIGAKETVAGQVEWTDFCHSFDHAHNYLLFVPRRQRFAGLWSDGDAEAF
jgi:hypothetical protein